MWCDVMWCDVMEYDILQGNIDYCPECTIYKYDLRCVWNCISKGMKFVI